MLLFIDNYDSFTYNIVQCFAELSRNAEVRCNDDIASKAIAALKSRYLVIGPGPYTPRGVSISVAAIRCFTDKLPIMGVCLDHQAVSEALGGDVVRARILMRDKVSPVFHRGKDMFKNLSDPVTCARYHSLVIDCATLPECLEVASWAGGNEIMNVRHKNYTVEGVQFHPEALSTEYGHNMLRSFLEEFKNFKTA